MRTPGAWPLGWIQGPHNSRTAQENCLKDEDLASRLGFENLCAARSNAMGNLSQIVRFGDTRERARRRADQWTLGSARRARSHLRAWRCAGIVRRPHAN